jgi:hypothetical protein
LTLAITVIAGSASIFWPVLAPAQTTGAANEVKRPEFKDLRFDEDWSSFGRAEQQPASDTRSGLH